MMIRSILFWGFLAISWMKGVYGACSTALGMASGYISDNQISASSQLSILAGPSYARLYHRSGLGGWCASDKDQNPYLQIDLLTAHTITKVATQAANSNWVKEFTLTFSYDNKNWFNYTVNGKIKVFTGNSSPFRTKWNYLTQPLTFRLVRFHPVHDPDMAPCLRVELYGCKQRKPCSTALGMESGYISDNQLSASSQLASLAGPSYARLNYRRGLGGWCARDRDQNLYLQIDLLTAHTITKVATQGANSNWVQKFTLTFSYDSINWFNYTVNRKIKVFKGNRNLYRTKWNYLTQPLIARAVRFHPVYDPDMAPCLRVELYGCGSCEFCKDLPTEITTTSRSPYVATKSSSSSSTFSPSTSKDPLSETTTSQTSRSPDIYTESPSLPSTFSPSISIDQLRDEFTTKKPEKPHEPFEPRKPHEPKKYRALELQNQDDDFKRKIVFGICVTIIIMLLVGLVFYAISYRQKKTDGFEIMPDDTNKTAQTARGYSFQNPGYFVREGVKQKPEYSISNPAYKTTHDPDRESRL